MTRNIIMTRNITLLESSGYRAGTKAILLNSHQHGGHVRYAAEVYFKHRRRLCVARVTLRPQDIAEYADEFDRVPPKKHITPTRLRGRRVFG